MPTYQSARGQKASEVTHRPEGRNTIITIATIGNSGFTQIDWGPDYESITPPLTIEQALNVTLGMGRRPLLWTYAEYDANYTELKLGFDDPIAGNKIGHVAMTEQATISGEIFKKGSHWKINNESGAWGSMGGQEGKSEILRRVAQFMTTHCGGMQVEAKRAYSKNATKRAMQQIFR